MTHFGARNPNASPDDLRALARVGEAHLYIAENTRTPADVLREFAQNTTDHALRGYVARNTSTPLDVVVLLA